MQKFEDIMQSLSHHAVPYFIDAVHSQHNPRPSYAWLRTGQEREISSNSGIKRLNLHGAMNAHNLSEILLVEPEQINAQSIPKSQSNFY